MTADCAPDETFFGETYFTTYTGSAPWSGFAPIVKFVSVSDDFSASSSSASNSPKTLVASEPTSAASGPDGTTTQGAGVAPLASQTASSSPVAQSGLSTGTIAAIAVPIALVIVLAGALIAFFVMSRRKKNVRSKEQPWSPLSSEALGARDQARYSEELAQYRRLSSEPTAVEKPEPAATVAGTIDDFVPHGG